LRTIAATIRRGCARSSSFTESFYAGETLQLEFHHQAGGKVRFRARVVERDEIVLDRCGALID
jgi:hypothetical protein